VSALRRARRVETLKNRDRRGTHHHDLPLFGENLCSQQTLNLEVVFVQDLYPARSLALGYRALEPRVLRYFPAVAEEPDGRATASKAGGRR
jgi:hypothetical protein